MSHTISSPDFMGRQHEVDELKQALLSRSTVVDVEGESGIGKTRLVREAIGAAELAEHEVLIATCLPYGEALTLGSIVDCVREAAGDRLADLRLSRVAGILRPLLPEWESVLPAAPEPVDDPGTAQHLRFRAIAELIGGLGVQAIVVDDVHWADDATLDFLLYLTSRHGGQALTVVMTYRPEDAPPGSSLATFLSRRTASSRFRRIVLGPLDVENTRALVSSMLGGKHVTHDFGSFLHRHTEGVPLAIEETIQLLGDRADLVHRNGTWLRRSLTDLQVPPTLRDAVVDRIRRVNGIAQTVMKVLAILAEPVTEDLLAQVAQMTTDDARTGLSEAIEARLISDEHPRGYAFRHSLARRAFYDTIPLPERRHLHHRAGVVLEQVKPPQFVQLTRHFRVAGDTQRWCRYAEEAADLAMTSDDYTTATSLLHAVVTGTSLASPERGRLLMKLASAAVRRRDAIDDLHRQVVDAVGAAADDTELDFATRAILRSKLGRMFLQVGEFDAGRRQLEIAASHLEHDPFESARVMTYLGYPLSSPRPVAEHRQWLDRAAKARERVRDPIDRLKLTLDCATAQLLLGDAEGWTVAAAMPDMAFDSRTRGVIVQASVSLAYTARVWGRYAEARRIVDRCLSLVDEREERHKTDIDLTLVYLDWLNGRWDDASKRIDSVAGSTVANRQTETEVALLSGLVEAARGDRDHAESSLNQVLTDARRHSAPDIWFAAAAAIARLRLASRHIREALDVTNAPVELAVETGLWVLASVIVPARVAALVSAEREHEAGQLVDIFGRSIAGVDAPSATAAAATSRALLVEASAQHYEAAQSFASSAALWEQMTRPYDALVCGERQAENVLHIDREDGIVQLERVFRGLDGLGAKHDADRVAARLRTLGVDVTRQWRRGRRGYGTDLSPRELEVVRLVATGQTNREIAQQLSRSPKTIAAQVNSAMRKLSVTSRTALAVSAIENGIVSRDDE